VDPTKQFVDRDHLQRDAYADSAKLNARRDIYRFQIPAPRFPAWALDHLPRNCGRVIDVGCGPGIYLARLSAESRLSFGVGLDLSHGMAVEASAVTTAVGVADAQHLPIRDGAFDTCLCVHMLYHVPDIDRAVSELRRVTRRGGTTLIATNGDNHQRELRDVFDAAVGEITGEAGASVFSLPRRFRMESAGEILGRHFEVVDRDDLPGELVVPEAEPVLAYVESIRSFHEPNLPAGVRWEDVVERLTEKVQAEIDSEGAFRVQVHAGVFVCR
jgi:SAM-dependent methyltransferase